MKIFERFLGLFSNRRQLMLGAMAQPVSLMDIANSIRAQALFKITGKQLSAESSSSPRGRPGDMKSGLSPTRRLARRPD